MEAPESESDDRIGLMLFGEDEEKEDLEIDALSSELSFNVPWRMDRTSNFLASRRSAAPRVAVSSLASTSSWSAAPCVKQAQP